MFGAAGVCRPTSCAIAVLGGCVLLIESCCWRLGAAYALGGAPFALALLWCVVVRGVWRAAIAQRRGASAPHAGHTRRRRGRWALWRPLVVAAHRPRAAKRRRSATIGGHAGGAPGSLATRVASPQVQPCDVWPPADPRTDRRLIEEGLGDPPHDRALFDAIAPRRGRPVAATHHVLPSPPRALFAAARAADDVSEATPRLRLRPSVLPPLFPSLPPSHSPTQPPTSTAASECSPARSPFIIASGWRCIPPQACCSRPPAVSSSSRQRWRCLPHTAYGSVRGSSVCAAAAVTARALPPPLPHSDAATHRMGPPRRRCP